MEEFILRDRDSEFEPQLVKKHQSEMLSIEDKIIFFTLKTHPRYQKTMREMYSIDVDDRRVSNG